MLSSLLRKKLSDEKIANIFVNAILEVTDKGYQDVVNMILEDPAFVKTPQISPLAENYFTMIVIVGNMKYLQDHFDIQQLGAVEDLIVKKLSVVFGVATTEFNQWKKEYESFMNRVNHPSKNVLYSMSKGIFHKFKLNDYQDDYFKKMQAPNPLFLKRLDEIVNMFVWDWDAFFKKYKLSA